MVEEEGSLSFLITKLILWLEVASGLQQPEEERVCFIIITTIITIINQRKKTTTWACIISYSFLDDLVFTSNASFLRVIANLQV